MGGEGPSVRHRPAGPLGGGVRARGRGGRTDVDGHEVAVAQRVHVLQHVALVEHGVLQPELAEKAAVALVSDRHVVPAARHRKIE